MEPSALLSNQIKPACFDKNTIINLSNNVEKKISDIICGDVLHDGSIVTDIMKLSTYGQTIYNLDNIIVTGLHRIFSESVGWIKVFEHPLAYEITDYRETMVYCLNTDSKTIEIDGYKFVDWDDLNLVDIIQLKSNCQFLPKNFNCKDIHKYLDNGFDENTMIDLEIGTRVPIKDIDVNDILRFGERILGIVKIDTTDINCVNEYTINGNNIVCTQNITFWHETLGSISTSHLEGNPVNIENNLYQLITDKGHYYIGEIAVRDYNHAIEKYLDNTSFYSQLNYN